MKIVGYSFVFALVLAVYSYFTGDEWGDLAAVTTFIWFFGIFLVTGLIGEGLKKLARWRGRK